MTFRMLRASLCVAVLAVSLTAAAVQARDVTADERTALATTIQDFDKANKAKDMDRVIGALPPRFIEKLAQMSGVGAAELRAALVSQSAETMKAITGFSFTVDMQKAKFRALPDGTPYVFIPSTTVVTMGDAQGRESYDVLAMLEGGKWYLLKLNQPAQVQLFLTAYPEFAGVDFNGVSVGAAR